MATPKVITELFLDNAWTDISSDVRETEPVQIVRGRRDESAQTDPGSCSLVVNNRHGKYSPQNPLSTYYGKIGRNTPIRVRLGVPYSWSRFPGTTGSYLYTPDHASLDIPGDLDLRMEIHPDSWRKFQLLAAKDRTGGQRTWQFHMLADGRIELSWTPSGDIGGTRKVAPSTAAVSSTAGRIAVRVTLDIDNGAGGSTLQYFTAPTISGPWTQLGANVIVSGVTSMFNSDARLSIGALHDGGFMWSESTTFKGKVHALELRNGIGGTVVARPNLDSATIAPFTDSAGKVWTAVGLPEDAVRFVGEVSSWPSRWDISDSDVWVPLEAAGVLRRLGQGASPLRSAWYRGMMNRNVTKPVAYWPCEDGQYAIYASNEVPGGDLYRVSMTGNPLFSPSSLIQFAANNEFQTSEPLPVFKGPTGTNTTPVVLQGLPRAYPPTNNTRVMVLVRMPEDLATEQPIVQFTASGSATQWVFNYDPARNPDAIWMYVQDRTGGESTADLVDTYLTINMLGKPMLMVVDVIQSGANLNWGVSLHEVDSPYWALFNGTISGKTLGMVQKVFLAHFGEANPTEHVAGHVSVHNVVTHDGQTLLNLSDAWRNERASGRINRLCNEEDVSFRLTGTFDETPEMGPQLPVRFLDLIAECVLADNGVLSEQRNATGLAYRTRANIYNQGTSLVFDYSNGEISSPFEPVDDDQRLRNDVTVERQDGGRARVVKESGPLSTQAPPLGVGTYDESVTLNLNSDRALLDQAGMRLHFGTVDELRYPVVRLNMANPRMAARAEEVLRLDVSQRIRIDNLPDWLPYGIADLVLEGYTERLHLVGWEIELTCSPAAPWAVGTINSSSAPDARSRADTEASQLNAAVTASAVSIAVLTTKGPVWTTNGAHMPFDIRIGGEVMRVTAIGAASGNVQTFTVTRGINGISTAHAAGANVGLAYSAIVSF